MQIYFGSSIRQTTSLFYTTRSHTWDPASEALILGLILPIQLLIKDIYLVHNLILASFLMIFVNLFVFNFGLFLLMDL